MPRTLLVLGATGFLGAQVCSAARVRWSVVAAARRPERLPAAARPERLRLAAWDDNFVSTYKVANYQLAPGVSCQ